MLITKDHLSKYRTAKQDLIVAQIKHMVHNYMKIEEDKDSITVFLSHKHNENEVLKEVVVLLSNLKVEVYLDWEDEEMPEKTSGATAIKIKDKIKSNKKFILLATEKAIESKWCNWELGYGDSHKYSDNIAIMPIIENDGSWPGNEYLQIYPIIKTNYRYSTGDYYVEFQNKKISLEEWLKN